MFPCCLGADRLKRQVSLVARQNSATSRTGPLAPLLAAVGAVRVPGGLMRDITAAINEDGDLADSSSEQVGSLPTRRAQCDSQPQHADTVVCCCVVLMMLWETHTSMKLESKRE